MFQYICLNPIADRGLRLLSDNYKKTDTLEKADIVLVRSASMHTCHLGEQVLAVARAGAGVNNIPLEAYARQGIVVFNTPGANANGVKELVLAALLYASRDIAGGMAWCLEHKEDADITKKAEKEKKRFVGTEILNKKLGVIGLGAIGIPVANAALDLGMEVYGYDPYISVERAWQISERVIPCTDVTEIYQTCDFISIHVPLSESTKHLIDADAISQMKANVNVLNFSRDLVVDETAMVKALEEGRVKHYITDFVNTTVAGKKGCIVTPHLGASTLESEENCAMMAVRQIKDYLEQGNITHSVNYPDCNMGICKTACRISILHKNEDFVMEETQKILKDETIKIAQQITKNKGAYAYSLLDAKSLVTEDIGKKIKDIDGVLKVRIIRKDTTADE